MSKKAKSKQPARKKYVTAGALGYNQANYTGSDFASPYATNPFYYDAGAAMAAQQQMKSAMSASQILQQRASEEKKVRDEEEKTRQAELKSAREQAKIASEQEVKAVGMDAATTAGDLGKQYVKQKLVEKATQQAATNAIANTAMQAGQAGVYGSTLGTAANTAASVGLGGTQVASFAAPTTSTVAGTLVPGAVEVGSQVGQAAANSGGSVVNAAGTGASLGAGLATAGIGLGLNIGGTLLEKSGDDYDPTTFTEKERKRNLAGSAMKSAGTGVGTGAAIGSFLGPGGTVIGGAIGGLVGGGIGLIKAKKENKEAKKIADEYQQAENVRLAEIKAQEARIAAENAKIAGAYNAAFVKSRLAGAQSGYGYSTSNNPSMMTTPSFYGETGGVRVPGGKVVPIEGSDAVEFVGNKHSEKKIDGVSGIRPFPDTEVEGGETMDQVMMAKSGGKGKMNDYFFSAYLKLGGKSFAQRHKDLIKNGASQKEIQKLAKMQEAVANKKGEKDRSPRTVKEYGGPRQYQIAGFRYDVPSASEEEYQVSEDPLTKNISSYNWSGHKKSSTPAPATGLMVTYSAVPGFEDRNKKAQEEEAAKKASTSSKSKSKSSKKKAEPASTIKLTDNETGKIEDPVGLEAIEADIKAREAIMSSAVDPTALPQAGDGTFFIDRGVGTKENEQKLAELQKERKKKVKEKPKGTNKKEDSVKDNFTTPSVMAGLAQLIPAGYILATPYKKTAPIDTSGAEFQAQSVAPGAVVRGATLGRQSSGAEKAAAIANAAAINKYIEGSNAGPGAIIGKLAVSAKLNEQLMKIQEQDDRANLALASKEAELGQRASEFNAQQAVEAAAATAENRQRASENLQKAKMFNAQMEMSEKQFADERKVAALNLAVRGIAGTVGDALSYRAQERLAKVIQEGGEYDRFKLKELMNTDPAFANLTQDQKNEIVASMSAANKAQLGGARRYTSRLGDLNRGKNKRNFNI